MAHKKYIAVTNRQGIQVDEYEGKFSLCSAWQTDEGDVKLNWCRVFKGKDDKEGKNLPIKVYLGEDVIGVLRQIISAVEEFTDKDLGKAAPEDDKCPF